MAQNHDDEIVQRQLDRDDPAVAVAETVAELDGRDPTEMDTIYGTIDHVVDHIFSDPPAPEAQVEITFSYEGYRITVEQNGTAEFVDVE